MKNAWDHFLKPNVMSVMMSSYLFCTPTNNLKPKDTQLSHNSKEPSKSSQMRGWN